MKKEYSRFEESSVFEGIVSIRTLVSSMQENNGYNDRRIITVYYSTERAEKEKKELSWLKHRSRELGFELIMTERSEIDAICVGNTHGGIAAIASARNLLTLDDKKIKSEGFYVMLEGVEDPYNFGYALRSLYAAGVDGVVVGERNWMSAAGVVCRASAGASEMIPIYKADASSGAVADVFRSAGYKIVCADLENSVPIYDVDLSYPLFLVIGGERRGISRALLDKADSIVRIDYGRTFEAALSAASAATVVSFEVLRQRIKGK